MHVVCVCLCVVCVLVRACLCVSACVHNNSNNILYPSLWEIKAVVRLHNKEHISIILSH